MSLPIEECTSSQVKHNLKMTAIVYTWVRIPHNTCNHIESNTVHRPMHRIHAIKEQKMKLRPLYHKINFVIPFDPCCSLPHGFRLVETDTGVSFG